MAMIKPPSDIPDTLLAAPLKITLVGVGVAEDDAGVATGVTVFRGILTALLLG
jgi:hypothetical protein